MNTFIIFLIFLSTSASPVVGFEFTSEFCFTVLSLDVGCSPSPSLAFFAFLASLFFFNLIAAFEGGPDTNKAYKLI